MISSDHLQFTGYTHLENFSAFMDRDKMAAGDIERCCLFYLASGCPELREKFARIYDFKQHQLFDDSDFPVLASSSEAILHLAKNLYNYRYKKKADPASVFPILDPELRRLCANAIQIRYDL